MDKIEIGKNSDDTLGKAAARRRVSDNLRNLSFMKNNERNKYLLQAKEERAERLKWHIDGWEDADKIFLQQIDYNRGLMNNHSEDYINFNSDDYQNLEKNILKKIRLEPRREWFINNVISENLPVHGRKSFFGFSPYVEKFMEKISRNINNLEISEIQRKQKKFLATLK